MDKNTKDQLITLLDTPAKRTNYMYEVEEIHRRAELPSKHTLGWDVRLISQNNFMDQVEAVIGIAKSVYPGVMVFMDPDDKSHLLLR